MDLSFKLWLVAEDPLDSSLLHCRCRSVPAEEVLAFTRFCYYQYCIWCIAHTMGVVGVLYTAQ